MKRVFAWAAAHLVAACYLLALALWVLWALGNAGRDALGFATGRLTTVEAERTLIESGVRRENRKKHIDQIAAVFILQGYLDYLHMKKAEERAAD